MTAAGNDWIEWNGGECPVAEGVIVVAKLRCGEILPPIDGTFWNWADNDFVRDIVAYRLVESSKLPEGNRDVSSALSQQVAGTHYKECKIQPVEFSEANKLQYLEGSIVARAARHDKATGKGAEDIRKIIHEAQLLLQLRYGEVA